MKKKHILILVSSIATVLVIAAIVVAGVMVYADQPENVVADSLTGAVEGLMERDELRPVANMLTQGSLTVNVNSVKRNYGNGKSSDVLGGMSGSGKVYFSSDALMLEDVNIIQDKKSVIKNADLYLSDSLIYLKEENFLHDADEHGYALKLHGLREQLEQSILNPTSKSEYALESKELFDEVCRIADYLDTLDVDELSEDVQDLYNDLLMDLYDIVLRHVTLDEYTKNVKFDNGTQECRVLTMRLTDRDSYAMLIDIVEYLEKDTKFPTLLKDYWPLSAGEAAADNVNKANLSAALQKAKSSVDAILSENNGSFGNAYFAVVGSDKTYWFSFADGRLEECGEPVLNTSLFGMSGFGVTTIYVGGKGVTMDPTGSYITAINSKVQTNLKNTSGSSTLSFTAGTSADSPAKYGSAELLCADMDADVLVYVPIFFNPTAADQGDSSDELLAISPDVLIDTYRDALREVKDELKKAAKEVDEQHIEGTWVEGCVEFVTTKRSSDLLRISATITMHEYGEKDEEISLFCLDFGGESIVDATRISLDVWDDEDVLVYEIAQDDKKGYKGTLTMSGETIFEVSIDKTKDEAPFEISLYINDYDYTFSGTIEESRKKTTIKLEKFEKTYVNWEYDEYTTTYDLDIELIIDEEDDIPSTPKKYTEVSEITDKDIKRWEEQFGKLLG